MSQNDPFTVTLGQILAIVERLPAEGHEQLHSKLDELKAICMSDRAPYECAWADDLADVWTYHVGFRRAPQLSVVPTPTPN